MIDGNFTTDQDCSFAREIFVTGNCKVGANSTLQALAVDGDLELGDGVVVRRWADAHGAIVTHSDVRIDSRLTSRTRVKLGHGSRALSAFAPEVVTEAFIQCVKVQKEHIGEPLDSSNGLQGLHSPGIGVWESDDDMVMIGGEMYREFVAPYVSRILDVFGGGSVHFCGRGVQHINNLLSMPNLKVVNNSPLGNFKADCSNRDSEPCRKVPELAVTGHIDFWDGKHALQILARHHNLKVTIPVNIDHGGLACITHIVDGPGPNPCTSSSA